MKHVYTKFNTEWHMYCDIGLKATFADKDGKLLFTGDTVEIHWLPEDGESFNEDTLYGVHMVVCDQHGKFVNDDRVYLNGWFNADWENDHDDMRLIKRDHCGNLEDGYTLEGGIYRIVEDTTWVKKELLEEVRTTLYELYELTGERTAYDKIVRILDEGET